MGIIKGATDAAKEAIEGGSEPYSNENPGNLFGLTPAAPIPFRSRYTPAKVSLITTMHNPALG
ncbi:MAG: hypothetical protein RBR45_07970 [Pseudomonas sp.]|nr:hypothetical protein [Pseudomonas sp.]